MRAVTSGRRRDSVRLDSERTDGQIRRSRVHSHGHGTLSQLQTAADRENAGWAEGLTFPLRLIYLHYPVVCFQSYGTDFPPWTMKTSST